MAAPTINTTTSVLGYKQFESWSYQPFATDSPTSWASSTLPAGMSFNTTTGLLSGAATAAGVYVVAITATNGTGTSSPLTLTIGIEAAAGASSSTAVELTYDLATGKVSSTGEGGMPPAAKNGDTLLAFLYFKKGETVVDPGTLDALQITLKSEDVETAPLAESTDWEKVAGAAPYYRVILPLTSAALATALGDNEPSAAGDVESNFAALAEISFTKEETVDSVATDITVTSQNFRWPIYRQLD